MTYKEIIQKTVEGKYRGVNNTCNGICSKCGECCGHVLPLDQKDLDQIVEYVVKNNIYSNATQLILQNKLQCPYYTGKRDKGCAIYQARPKICRYYKCDKKNISYEEFEGLRNAIPCDMWLLAKELDKEIERNRKNGKEKSRRR